MYAASKYVMLYSTRMTLVHGNNDVIVLGRAIFIKAVVHRRPAAVYVHFRLLYFIKHQ